MWFFEDEIFPFIPLGVPRYDLDGTVTSETNGNDNKGQEYSCSFKRLACSIVTRLYFHKRIADIKMADNWPNKELIN